MTLSSYTISRLKPVIFGENGAHLTNRGKSILVNNFVTKVNKFYNIDSDFLMRRPNQPSVR